MESAEQLYIICIIFTNRLLGDHAHIVQGEKCHILPTFLPYLVLNISIDHHPSCYIDFLGTTTNPQPSLKPHDSLVKQKLYL